MNTPTQRPYKTTSDTFQSASLRVDTIIWLADAEKLLGYPASEDEIDVRDLALHCLDTHLDGFLVKFATPLPRDFSQDGRMWSCGWGISTSAWFYFKTFDPQTMTDAALEWATGVKERQWQKELKSHKKKKAQRKA